MSCRSPDPSPAAVASGSAATPGPTASAVPPRAAEHGAATVHIAFTAKDPHAYCRKDDCSGTSLVTLRRRDATAKLLLSPGPCPVRCEDCRAVPCPSTPCPGVGVAVTHAELDWDGSYYETGVCGQGVSCVTRKIAAPGRYVADVCATRGERTNDSIGFPVCIESGERACASVELSYPGDENLAATW